jgi:hypothetical protein
MEFKVFTAGSILSLQGEGGHSRFLRDADFHVPDYMASHPKRQSRILGYFPKGNKLPCTLIRNLRLWRPVSVV